ncbi:MAG: hypothetical protein PHH77_01040 [Victivallaceae bacterium]|nr:hypothetical protein [Victivallaceae bacterium]
MTFCRKIFIGAVFFSSVFICRGAAEKDTLDKVFFRDFDDDSYFVTIPTYAGNYLGLIIGAIPAACVAGGFQFANAAPATVEKSALITLTVFAKPIGLLVGLPFKLVKVICWDSPKYIYGGITGDTDPPAPVPGVK